MLAPAQTNTDQIHDQIIGKIGKCQFQREGEGDEYIRAFQSLGGIHSGQKDFVILHALVVAVSRDPILHKELPKSTEITHTPTDGNGAAEGQDHAFIYGMILDEFQTVGESFVIIADRMPSDMRVIERISRVPVRDGDPVLGIMMDEGVLDLNENGGWDTGCLAHEMRLAILGRFQKSPEEAASRLFLDALEDISKKKELRCCPEKMTEEIMRLLIQILNLIDKNYSDAIKSVVLLILQNQILHK
jgi:hypothetical protein